MRPKRTLLILIQAGVALLLFAARTAQANPPARVVNKELHCSFEVPDGWQQKTDVLKPMWMYINKKEAGHAANVGITVGNVAMPALPEQSLMFAAIRKQYGSRGNVYDTKQTTMGGRTAYSCRVHLQIPGLPVVENRQIFCVNNTRLYVMTFTAPAGMQKKYDPIGDKIIASFRFEK